MMRTRFEWNDCACRLQPAAGGVRLRRAAAALALAALAAFGGPTAPARAAIQTRHVVIVAIDGARYSETLGHPSLAYQPRIGGDLAAVGSRPSLFQNVGITNTVPGMSAMVTGTLQPIANDGSERPHLPTLFEYLRQQKGTPESLVRLILRKPKLNVLAYSDHPAYGATYGAHVNASLLSDLDVFLAARDEILANRPVLTLVHFGDPDIIAHGANWSGYLTAIRLADSLTWQLWSAIQSDPVMAGKTTMFVTNDHGRHDDLHGGYVNHGDGCDGCRRIEMVMAGPDCYSGYLSGGAHEQRCIARTAGYLLGVSMPLAAGRVMDDLLLEPSAPFVGVGPRSPSSRLVLAVVPNPTNAGAAVRVTGPGAEVAHLDLLDASGRRIVALRPTAVTGPGSWQWDGRDASGHELPPGHYLVRASSGAIEGRATLVKLH